MSTGSSGECEHRCGSQGKGKMDKPIIIETKKYEDFRGWLSVPLDKEIDFHVVQINQGYSRKKFTLRGLHYQEGEHAQAKLVSCLQGSILNVAVDLRQGDTFGYAYGEHLSFENQKQMLIPRGFAHGYLTPEDDTLMQWCVDNDFCAEAARAVGTIRTSSGKARAGQKASILFRRKTGMRRNFRSLLPKVYNGGLIKI